jgi:hypothetical protein
MTLFFSYENKQNKTKNPLKLKVKLSKNITLFKNDLNLEKERKKVSKKLHYCHVHKVAMPLFLTEIN